MNNYRLFIGKKKNKYLAFIEMKKIGKLVLNQIAKKELTQRQMGKIKGGRNSCTCGCCYADNQGSAIDDNGCANWRGNMTSYCPNSPPFGGFGACDQSSL